MATTGTRLMRPTAVVPDKDEPISPRTFSSDWRDVADAIELAGAPLQGLRHTHVSQLIDATIDVVTISKPRGHASPALTLRVYAHRNDDSKAAKAINAALANKSKN